jgi:glycine/serine hydroxymethyltransferase
MKEPEMEIIAELICDTLLDYDRTNVNTVKEVEALCGAFPLYN